jgi:hypothetical protein
MTAMTRHALATLAVFASVVAAADPPRKAENVLVVTVDGFRWQEFFTGADESFLDSKQGVRNVAELKKRYWRDTPQARREALLPFLWSTVAKQGQVFGNPAKKSPARITNGLKFSYPGYNEMLCGFADPRINSNAKKENPNANVFEFLAGRPAFKDRVELFGTWDVFPFILRTRTNKLPILAGWEPIPGDKLTDRERWLNETMALTPHYWPDNAFDVFTMGAARSAIEQRKPRVLYVALGETDEWAHGRRYDLYLDSARNSDRFLAETWERLQADPQYKGKTALVVTTDHGRGSTRVDWTDHGPLVPGAEFVWMVVLGPDTPAVGEVEGVEVTQSQVAATIAALIGEDFGATDAKVAKPLPVFAK